MDNTVGVITEQGDLGLGFDPIAEEDQEKIKEAYAYGNPPYSNYSAQDK